MPLSQFYRFALLFLLVSACKEPKRENQISTVPRGGNSFSPNSTGNNDNQVSGASFKFITDLSDWDKTLMINSPGQSGNLNSKYYGNLHEMWTKNEYFPAYYSKEKIKKVTESSIMLMPANN